MMNIYFKSGKMGVINKVESFYEKSVGFSTFVEEISLEFQGFFPIGSIPLLSYLFMDI